MGGGANLYRKRLVSEWLEAGDAVALLSFDVGSMSTYVEVRDGEEVFERKLANFDALAAALASSNLVEILLNCAVSFTQVGKIQQLLLDLKRISNATLAVAIHEYFVICPSPFLLDKNGKYCGVPSTDRCNSCLREHDDGFVSLTGERSIERWRKMWTEVLSIADEVRCFSQSSKRLLERAYPDIAKHATLRPHDVEPLRRVRQTRVPGGTLTIGVIGFISHHKGAGVVVALAEAISAAGADARIVVFGSLEGAPPSDVILQTGSYNRYDLPGLLEKYEVNIALMPSICPETFSFVAHEVVSMGLPLMSLDLGAQADLARSVATGRVSPRQDGPGLLAEIMAFDRDLYFLNAKAHP
ncbi:group 1 glycosyl transferase [Achromobacter aloeverae]|uniref:Group 1 glycosyl transferase n=2 Tax=Achromobacter aloeverae TaxID=1750518 RepID=A0A4Q1HK91_9BURK|nr:group 1 glycosyl transferase [Achromobacter aloeverae]